MRARASSACRCSTASQSEHFPASALGPGALGMPGRCCETKEVSDTRPRIAHTEKKRDRGGRRANLVEVLVSGYCLPTYVAGQRVAVGARHLVALAGGGGRGEQAVGRGTGKTKHTPISLINAAVASISVGHKRTRRKKEKQSTFLALGAVPH